MPRSVRFVVPGQAVPKKRARSGNGTHYTPAETRRYEDTVAWVARSTGIKFDRVPVTVTIAFYLDTRRGDVDNLAKSILDGLEKAGMLPNDQWVDELHLRRHIKTGASQHVDIHVEELAA